MPNPRKGLTSDYDYIGVKDIEGASPKKIMGVITLSFFISFSIQESILAEEDRILK